jgi:hypothetical protein
MGNYIRVTDFKEMLKPGENVFESDLPRCVMCFISRFPRFSVSDFSSVAITVFTIHTGKYLNSGAFEW